MRNRQSKTVYRMADWTVRPSEDRLERGGACVTVEPRAMDVLACLIRHAGETVSADQLVGEVWRDTIVSDAPLYQSLTKLRKALGDSHRRPRYIETVRKRGYRLIAPVSIVPTTYEVTHPARSPFGVTAISLLLSAVFMFFGSSDVAVTGIDTQPLGFRSIAVLPFIDMSADGSQQHFGDGIADEIIQRLSVAPELRVVGRTSSFSFRDNVDLRTVGESLDADVILEGSVRRHSNRIRVTAQLVNAVDGYRIWSHAYEPELSDPLDIQDQIAQSVARYLHTGLSDDELPRRAWTEIPGAAEAYYFGQFHMQKRREKSLKAAIEHFHRAIERDPQFALAYAALAKAKFLASAARFGSLPAAQAMQDADAAILIARSLNDELAEVHEVLSIFADDWQTARIESLRAIEISPNHADAYHVYAHALSGLGRFNDALLARKHSVNLNPLAPLYRTNLAHMYRWANRRIDSDQQLETAIEIDPDWHVPYAWLAVNQIAAGKLSQAISTAKTSIAVEGPQARWAGQVAAIIGSAYVELQDFAAADKWFKKAEKLGERGWSLAELRIEALLAQDRYAEADNLFAEWEEKEASFAESYLIGGLYRSVMGESDDAIRLLEQAASIPYQAEFAAMHARGILHRGYLPAAHLAFLYADLGKHDAARRLLAECERFIAQLNLGEGGYPGVLYVIAEMHALRGHDDLAMDTLNRAVEDGWSRLWFMERDPMFARFRGLPRFESAVDGIRRRLQSERSLLLDSGAESRL